VSGDDFVFLEMNTRLQVEHPITELATGIDIVEQQLRIASGEDVTFDPDAVQPRGHAIEFRVYAEDPKRFLPSPGAITGWKEPAGEGIRVDAGYAADTTVTPFYDPLLAKLCVYGADRDEALAKARDAVSSFVVEGPKTNLPFFLELLNDPGFTSGQYDTGVIDRMRSGR
jgi:acetyl-CoA carboxylase biotin carboxylase subunit